MCEHRTMTSQTVLDSDEDLIYIPKISSPGNYRKFLHLSRTSSLSDDEAENDQGYIDDELFPNKTLPEKDPGLSSPPSTPPPCEHDVTELAAVTEEQTRDWQNELIKVEEEITTLRQVLRSKRRHVSELKQRLHITPLQEMKHDLQLGIKTIKDSSTFQKTSVAAKSAADKTSEVVTEITNKVAQKLGDLRNSQAFKSLECKMESAFASVKAKVSGSKSMERKLQETLEQEKLNSTNGAAATGQQETL